MWAVANINFSFSYTEGTAAGAEEAASGPVEDWFRGEFDHRAAARFY